MSTEILLKTRPEISRIRSAARIVASVLTRIAGSIRPGAHPTELNRLCTQFIEAAGAKPSMKGFESFPTETSISVNDVAAHGVPSDRPLRSGDVVTVDLAVDLHGWNADGAWTYLVPGAPKSDTLDQQRLIDAAWQCALAGVAAARPPNRLGEVANTVHGHARIAGFIVLPRFTGHGIGRSLHEDPSIYFAGGAARGQPIVPGLVCTIEPVIGTTEELARADDGFGYRTADGSPTAQFEHTIAVFSDRTEILTLPQISVNRHPFRPPSLLGVGDCRE